MILLIDNYDSFVYNLARYVRELGCATHVVRNDALTVAEIAALRPQAVVISPGPCTPLEAGVSVQVIRDLGATIPILGVCLGHQAIAAAFGGQVVRAMEPVHGRSSPIRHQGRGLFTGLRQPLQVGRYHSLVIDSATLPPDLEVVAETMDGVPMAVQHRRWAIHGVQFHPESVLTEQGHHLLRNFLTLAHIATGALPPGDLLSDFGGNPEVETGIAPGAPLHW